MNKNSKIIDGKRYSTDTATKVASWQNSYGYSDFHHMEEDLYITPKGAWFLVGEGGALSKYAQSCGNNSTCGGVEWTALSVDEAFEWLQQHHKTEELETYFADRIQDA